MTQLPTPKKMRGPFKPSFGLSGVVADPNTALCDIPSEPDFLPRSTRQFHRKSGEAEGSAVLLISTEDPRMSELSTPGSRP
jgi:hypothetical protein